MAQDLPQPSPEDSDRGAEDVSPVHPSFTMIDLLSEIISDSYKTANFIRLLVAFFVVATGVIAGLVGLALVLYPTLKSHSAVALPIATGLGSATFGSAVGLILANRRRRRKTRSLEELEQSFRPARPTGATPDSNGGGRSS
jgi:hypothetical protein